MTAFRGKSRHLLLWQRISAWTRAGAGQQPRRVSISEQFRFVKGLCLHSTAKSRAEKERDAPFDRLQERS
jgi:hypothetical protein